MTRSSLLIQGFRQNPASRCDHCGLHLHIRLVFGHPFVVRKKRSRSAPLHNSYAFLLPDGP